MLVRLSIRSLTFFLDMQSALKVDIGTEVGEAFKYSCYIYPK
jgi:hypothetical protein